MSRGFRWSLLPLLAAGALGTSCGDEKAGGGLLLLVSRDGSLPLDRVDLTIASKGKLLHQTKYRVPEEADVPTTFGITSNGDSTASVSITVTGWGQGEPLDRRDAIVTQVPSDRIALLRVVLSGRCTSKVMLVDGDAVSTCGEASTCDPYSGDCMSAEVDARKLPTYDPDHPDLGEGGAPGSGGEAGSSGAGAPGAGGGGGAAGDDGAGGMTSAGQGGEGGRPLACKVGFDDCDDDPTDCETDTRSDIDHCGACGKSCPDADGHGYCDAGKCAVTTCQAPLSDCNLDPRDGCEIDTTQSDANCLGCNQPCPESTPFCTPNGCSDHRDIQMMSNDAATFFWDEAPEGEAYRRDFTHTHSLTLPYREGDQGRVLVVGAVGDHAHLTGQSLRYAGVPMQPTFPAEHGTDYQIYLYYLMDGSLPRAPGDYPVQVTVNAIPAGGIALQLMELRNVRQIGELASNATAPDDCSPMFLGMSFLAQGAFTYQVAAAGGTQPEGPFLYPEPGFPVASISLAELDFSVGIGNASFISDNGQGLTWTSEVCGGGTGVVAGVSFARIGLDAIALP